jgi:sulfate transport system permease protein
MHLSKPAMPGFRLSMGITITWLSLIVLIPIIGVFVKSAGLGVAGYAKLFGSDRVLHALYLSFGAAFIAAVFNAVFGLLIAWVFVRYRFVGHRLLDAAIDLPFALPTAVAGIALAALYAPNGWLGEPLTRLGIELAFNPKGVVIALIFISLPFVVRTVEPVLREAEVSLEEAAATLGAGRWVTFRKVIFPTIFPALITGFTLAFARAIGEYGSVIFIAGNLPKVSEIAPLLIVIKLEEFDYAGATAVASTMLAVSFILLLLINALQSYTRRSQAR